MRRLKCQMLKEVWSFSVDRKLNKVWQGTVPMVDFMFLKDSISFKLSLDKLQRAYCTERSTKEFLPTGGQKYSKTSLQWYACLYAVDIETHGNHIVEP